MPIGVKDSRGRVKILEEKPFNQTASLEPLPAGPGPDRGRAGRLEPFLVMIFIGTSGYNYPHWWNGVFYPSDLPQKKWLEFYTEYFSTVELNVSFYRLPKKEVFEGWYKRTPKKFVFAVKGSRFITHIKRLKDCREPLSLLFDHASSLKEKLGVVLWQLPPRFEFERRDWRSFVFFSQRSPVLNIFATLLNSEMSRGSATRPFGTLRNLISPFASPTARAFLDGSGHFRFYLSPSPR